MAVVPSLSLLMFSREISSICSISSDANDPNWLKQKGPFLVHGCFQGRLDPEAQRPSAWRSVPIGPPGSALLRAPASCSGWCSSVPAAPPRTCPAATPSQVIQQACTPGTAESPTRETAESCHHVSFSLSLGKSCFPRHFSVHTKYIQPAGNHCFTLLPTIRGHTIETYNTPPTHHTHIHTTHTSHTCMPHKHHMHMHIPHTPHTPLTPHILTLSFPSQPKFYLFYCVLSLSFLNPQGVVRCCFREAILFTFMPIFYFCCWPIPLLSDRPSGNFSYELKYSPELPQ